MSWGIVISVLRVDNWGVSSTGCWTWIHCRVRAAFFDSASNAYIINKGKAGVVGILAKTGYLFCLVSFLILHRRRLC